MTLTRALSDKLRADEEVHEQSGYWYPSQLGKCYRQAVLEHGGVAKEELDARTLRVFWMGNRIHDALQTLYRTTLDVVGVEVPFRDERLKVSGRLDMLIRGTSGYEAIEFKSVNSNKFKYGNLPERAHVLQVGCYLRWPVFCPLPHSTKDQLEMDYGCDFCGKSPNEAGGLGQLPSRGRLIYWSKDDALMEEFVINRTPKIDQSIESEFTHLEELYQAYKATGALPDALPDTDWRTRYCGYTGKGQCCADRAPIEKPPLLGGSDSPSK
jgi:hypothetical protein